MTPGTGRIANRDRALALGKFLLVGLVLCSVFLIDDKMSQWHKLWLLAGVCLGGAGVLFSMVHYELPVLKMPRMPNWTRSDCSR